MTKGLSTYMLIDETKAKDPLAAAFEALKSGGDPLIESAREVLWRKLWARDNVKSWIHFFRRQPRFSKKLHLAIPNDDVELLNEIRALLEKEINSPQAFYILGLVNERLENVRENLGSRTPQQVPVGWEWLANAAGAMVTDSTKHNYQGYICAAIQDRGGRWLAGTSEHPAESGKIPSKTHCRLAVWMQPAKHPGAWADDILIETGRETDVVTFFFEVDCPSLPIPFGRKRLRFHRKQNSPLIYFDFFSPTQPGTHSLFLHVFQETKLVKSMMIMFAVGTSKYAPSRVRNTSRRNN